MSGAGASGKNEKGERNHLLDDDRLASANENKGKDSQCSATYKTDNESVLELAGQQSKKKWNSASYELLKNGKSSNELDLNIMKQNNLYNDKAEYEAVNYAG
jgi:hypothetical protein